MNRRHFLAGVLACATRPAIAMAPVVAPELMPPRRPVSVMEIEQIDRQLYRLRVAFGNLILSFDRLRLMTEAADMAMSSREILSISFSSAENTDGR